MMPILLWIITVTEPDNAKRDKEVAFKNNAPFINCISKINGVKIDNAADLDVRNYANKVSKNETEVAIPLKHLSNF